MATSMGASAGASGHSGAITPHSSPSYVGPLSSTGAGGTGSVPTIEGYTIGQCLGQGGMGAVYEGVQESTGRRVAVKIMLDAALVSEEGRKRFEREVAVVARLEHPAVVAIIDSGVRKGKYYYIMEYVEGANLDHLLKRGECDVNRTFELVAEVCDAVEYAHQRGVLHRDLKPANVLVDSRGRIRLLDFGIAQVLGEDAAQSRETLSSPGQIVGTVAYMSPEQAAGNASETSIRTDVYALGAIAYDLITGKLPCPVDGALVTILQRIAHVDPIAPSSHRKGLSRDIDAMLLRALEKIPANRYATAGEFAADIRRFLAGQPVHARPVGLPGRAFRLAMRNRTLTAVGAVFLITLGVVSAGLILRIIREKESALENWSRFASLLLSADPETSNNGGTVLQLMERFSKDLDKSPLATEESEADIREILGVTFRKFAVYDKSISNLRLVLKLREAHTRGDNPKLAKAVHNLAASLWWNGQYAEAETLYIQELDILRRLLPGDHADTASAMTGLAACRLRLGRVESARGDYTTALEMRKRLYGVENEQVAASLNNLAKCDLEIDAFDSAEAAFRAAYAMVKKLKGEEYMNTAAAATNLADCLLRRAEVDRFDSDQLQGQSRAREALDLYKKSFDVRTKKFPDGHDLTAVSLGGLSRASLFLGLKKEALDFATQGLVMMRKVRRADHPGMIDVLETCAHAASSVNDLAATRTYYEQAIDIAGSSKIVPASRLAELRGGYGLVLVQLGEIEPGLKLLRAAAVAMTVAHGNTSIASRLATQQLNEAEKMIAAQSHQKPD